MTARAIDLDHLTLTQGSHRSFTDGACIMEAVAYVATSGHPDGTHLAGGARN